MSDQRSHAGQSWAARSQRWDFAGTELSTASLGCSDLQPGLAKSTDLLQIGDLSNRWVYLNTGSETSICSIVKAAMWQQNQAVHPQPCREALPELLERAAARWEQGAAFCCSDIPDAQEM